MKTLLKTVLRKLGYEVRNLKFREASNPYPDFDASDFSDYAVVQPYTMVPIERIYSLTNAIRYLHRANIPGAFVECGVWRGGCSMHMARTLKRLGCQDRDLFLFDLFDLPWPDHTPQDGPQKDHSPFLADLGIRSAEELICTEDDVRTAMLSTGYSPERIHLVRGPVEQTLPAEAPETIALLRLDTDLYESTRHELRTLYPRLSPGGVLIIDDYGCWPGARAATDEFLEELAPSLLLHRIDFSARQSVKPLATQF